MIYLHHLHLKPGGKPTFSSSAARLQDLWRHSSLLATATTHCSQLCAYLCLPLRSFLEKEMATYSSILAWRTPWTEEPGGLQFMGWKKSDITEQLTHTHTDRSFLSAISTKCCLSALYPHLALLPLPPNTCQLSRVPCSGPCPCC